MAKKLEWTTVKVKVNDLIELDINPRKISEEQQQKLIKSLERFNLAEIPIANKDFRLIGGNQRCRILKMVGRGDETIDVRYPNRLLTETELKEYALTSNTHNGEWDFDILTAEFGDINLEDFDLDMSKLDLAPESRGSTDDEQEYTGKAKPNAPERTADMENAEIQPKKWYLYIDCVTETEAAEMFDEMTVRGFETKIVN